MPEFTSVKHDGQLIWDDYRSKLEWENKVEEGVRVRAKYSRVRGSKTSPQLGYYWGLLLPEIHKQYLREGITVSVRVPGTKLKADRKPVMLDSHEIIKDVCALVGDDGVRLDVGDMDDHTMSKFIDNVLFHATNDLVMNGEELEAKRPEPEKELF